MTVYNMLGQAVNGSNPSALAIGIYYYASAPEGHPCGALRPGFMVINHDPDGSGVIDICNGTTTTGHLPDVYLADDPWKPYIQWGLLAACAIMAVTVFKQAVK